MKSLITILIVISLVLFNVVHTGNGDLIDTPIRIKSSFCFILLLLDIPEDIYKKYNQSYNQWQIVKRQWNNSYQYTSGTSSWTGHRTTITMFIQNGEVNDREIRK